MESAKLDQSYLDIHRKQTELTQMIATQQARSLLPSHEPPTFSGDVMSYPAFVAAFETLIESKVDNSSELLYFLDQYTSGKAKELIKGCLQMKSGDSYKEARRLLKKHFGDPYKIASAYIAKVSNWPAVRPNDGTGLQEFSIALEQARNAMTGMQYMNDLNAANVLRQLWEKLPRYLRSKWTERASKIRNTCQQVATFNDFSEFVSQQPDLTTDPVYSEDSISRIQLTSNISRANASLRQEGVQISQRTCRQKRPLNETLFPSAVPCAQRHTTWMNVLNSLRNPSKTEDSIKTSTVNS